MKRSRLIALAVLILAASICCAGSYARDAKDIRLLYWNIQNGMWSDQPNNYDNFVEFVKSQDPDICVWCEGASIYYSNTADYYKTVDEKYLPYNWDSLAERYGHKYVYVAGWRDDYPQVVTSKFPIRNVKRILGDAEDVIVTHGAGWVQLEVQGKTLNIVTLHTWPQAYTYRAEDREASKAEHGGDKYRRREIERICKETILSEPDAKNQYWMMMGDFNSRSRVDSAQYDLPEDSPAYLVHDYIKESTPYRDIISVWYDKKFFPSTHNNKRIDFVYASPLLYACIRDTKIFPLEGWLAPVRDPQKLSNFYHPSDHLPILVDFNIGGECSPADLDFEWHDLDRGAQWAAMETEVFGAHQHISVVRYPAKKFKTEVANDSGLKNPKREGDPAAVDPEKPATTTSKFAERYGAYIAINAGYFNMRTLYPATYVKDGGEVEGSTAPNELPRVNGVVAFKGHRIDIFSCNPDEYDAKCKGYDEALACGPVLIEDGVVKGDWPETSFYISRHPRSIIGTTKDGMVYMIDIDGRWHGKAEGATIPETAEIARMFGLVNALNLDGGGSSTLWTAPTGVICHPNDNGRWDNKGERTVPNVIYAR